MPDGRTHERFNVLLGASGFSFLAWQKALPPELLLAGGAGFAVGTFLVTPDMDQAGKGGSRALRRWGPFAFLWLPYGLVFRHRGLSHLWPVGALTRLLYLALLASPLLALAPVRPFSPTLLAFLAGFLLADLLHVFLDRVGSLRKAGILALVLLVASGAKAESVAALARLGGSGPPGMPSGFLFPGGPVGLALPVRTLPVPAAPKPSPVLEVPGTPNVKGPIVPPPTGTGFLGGVGRVPNAPDPLPGLRPAAPRRSLERRLTSLVTFSSERRPGTICTEEGE
jgi:uncharacterized metal-binding protein